MTGLEPTHPYDQATRLAGAAGRALDAGDTALALTFGVESLMTMETVEGDRELRRALGQLAFAAGGEAAAVCLQSEYCAQCLDGDPDPEPAASHDLQVEVEAPLGREADGKWFAVIYHRDTGVELCRFDHWSWGFTPQLSADARLVAVDASDLVETDFGDLGPRYVGVYDVASGAQVLLLDAWNGARRVAFSPDGSLVAVASTTAKGRSWLEVVDIATDDCLVQLNVARVDELRFAVDGTRLLAEFDDGVGWHAFDATPGVLLDRALPFLTRSLTDLERAQALR